MAAVVFFVVLMVMALGAVYLLDTKLFPNKNKRTTPLPINTAPMMIPDNKAIESPDFPALLTDTVWSKLEKDWLKENPSKEDTLRLEIARLKDLVASKSKLIAHTNEMLQRVDKELAAKRKQVEWFENYVNSDSGSPMMMPNQIKSETELRELLDVWAVSAASRTRTSKHMIVIPQRTIAVPRNIQWQELPKAMDELPVSDYSYGGIVTQSPKSIYDDKPSYFKAHTTLGKGQTW